MKKSWPITLLVCLLILGGGALILGWPRTVPFEQCSEIYQKYANEEDIKASFIKDFKVNDTVFVDVTLLEATDSVGWNILKKDFEVPNLPLELQQLVDSGKDLVFTKMISEPAASHLLAISYLTKTLTVFHIENDAEKHAVKYHNFDKSTNL